MDEQPQSTDASLLNSEPRSAEVAPNPNIEIIPTEKHDWQWGEGKPGEGDVPEWFDNSKFKSVTDQAIAHKELQKKFGGFTGAPEDYEFSIAEGLEGKVGLDVDSEQYKAFSDFAKESNMSNDLFNNIINTHLESLAGSQEQIQTDMAENQKAELEKLGDDSANIINEVSSWGQNNLTGDEFEAFRGLASSAGNIKLLQKMITKTTSSKVDAKANTAPAFSRDDLRGMMADPRYMNDMTYRSEVDGKYRTLADSGRLQSKNQTGF